MPINPYSRYRFTDNIFDDIFSERDVIYKMFNEAIAFEDDPDNMLYVVQAGDTLHSIAFKFYGNTANSAQLWWVIANFQPVPIVDPTLQLKPGTILTIPSQMLVNEFVNTRLDASVV